MKYYINCFDTPLFLCKNIIGNIGNLIFDKMDDFSFYAKYKGDIVKLNVRDNELKVNFPDGGKIFIELGSKGFDCDDDLIIRILAAVVILTSHTLNVPMHRDTIKYKGKDIAVSKINIEACSLTPAYVGDSCPILLLRYSDMEAIESKYTDYDIRFDFAKIPFKEFTFVLGMDGQDDFMCFDIVMDGRDLYVTEMLGDSLGNYYVIEDIVGSYINCEGFLKQLTLTHTYHGFENHCIKEMHSEDISYVFSILKYINDLFIFSREKEIISKVVENDTVIEHKFEFTGNEGRALYIFNGITKNEKHSGLSWCVKGFSKKLRSGEVRYFPATVKYNSKKLETMLDGSCIEVNSLFLK